MNEEVARLYADVGLKISGALRGLRDFRSRLRASQGALKTLRDQSNVTAAALNVGITAGLGAVGVKAISALGDAGQAMSVFGLVTKASTGEMEQARAKVAELARDLSLPNATAAASSAALAELGKAGLSARDSIDALRPTMLLAAAGGLQGAEAAQILANTLSAFKLPGSEAATIANLLAGAEVAAAGSIRDHAQAMQQSMAVWALAKQPADSLITSIGLLANAGIIGSDAGTSLRTMMLRLISPTEEAAAQMRAMGISVYDAQGRVKPFRDILQQFEKGLAPLTEAQRNQRLETIFGTDAIRAAAIVFGGGVAAYDAMRGAVTQTGLAQDLATAKTEGLKGSIEGLTKSIDTASTEAVKPFEGDIKTITGSLSAALLAFSDLDDGTKRLIVGFGVGLAVLGAVAAAVTVVTSVAGGLMTAFAVIVPVLTTLGTFLAWVGAVLAFLSASPVALLVVAIAGLVAALVWAYNTSSDFRTMIDRDLGAAGAAFQAFWNVVRPIFDAFGGAIRTAIGWVGDLLRAVGLLPSSVNAPATQPVNTAPIPPQWRPPASSGGGVQAWVGGVPITPRARGGPVTGGQPYLVGERGPELFVPGSSGGIAANGAGGVTVNVVNNAPVYGFDDFEDRVVRSLDRAGRRWRA